MQMDMFKKVFSQLQKTQLKRIETMLTGMGCVYKIRTPDGETHSNREEVKVSKGGRKLAYPMGTWAAYIEPYLKDLKIGEVALVPKGEFEIAKLQQNVSSYAIKLWGNGAAVTARREDGVEVMRVAAI